MLCINRDQFFKDTKASEQNMNVKVVSDLAVGAGVEGSGATGAGGAEDGEGDGG